MAKAPARAKNAATNMVKVYDSEGNELEFSRLNALDLVRSGDYYWKAEDVNKPRSEDDGPVDPAAKTQTVYDAEGTPFEVDTANARDMINMGTYFWNNPKAAEAGVSEPTEPTPSEPDATETTTSPESTADTNVTVPSDVDPSKEPLLAQAQRVTGSDDVIAYLEGFTEKNLRDMASERYGEKLHHRSSKQTMIANIIEFEEAKTVAEDQADA